MILILIEKDQESKNEFNINYNNSLSTILIGAILIIKNLTNDYLIKK